MKKHQCETGSSLDPTTKMAVDLARAVAERSRMNEQLLIALANAVGTNERVQQKFRSMVLAILSRVQVMLTEVQGAQLVQFWPPDRVSDEQQTKYLREVEERVSTRSNEVGLKMVRYIYGESDEASVSRGRRRRWSDWEI